MVSGRKAFHPEICQDEEKEMKMAQEATAEELRYILAPSIQPHAPTNNPCQLFDRPSVNIGVDVNKWLQTLQKP